MINKLIYFFQKDAKSRRKYRGEMEKPSMKRLYTSLILELH